MKSLVQLSWNAHRLAVTAERQRGAPCTVLAVDGDSSLVYGASTFSCSGQVCVRFFALKCHDCRSSQSSTNSFAALDGLLTPAFDVPPSHRLVSLHAHVENGQLYAVAAGGEILATPLLEGSESPPSAAAQVDVVGDFEDGIAAASWSPDDDLLVAVTGKGKVVLMTKAFDVLSEELLETSDFGSDKPMDVGWGSKSTQFHGSLGKGAAKESEAPAETKSLTIDHDDGLPRISWRGDGAFFAISSTSKSQSTRRIIRVYARTGVLSSTSDLVEGQGSEMAWRPEGSIIAANQIVDDTSKIIFFERNGLRRYEYDLRRNGFTVVKHLSWNSDSSILGVLLNCVDGTGTEKSLLQLWTRNNYHWYLKQELPPFHCDTFDSFIWHREDPLSFFVASHEHIESYQLSWQVFADTKIAPLDSGMVAVVDGQNLLITPFRHQNVPPPMSTVSLHIGELTPIYVAFDSGSNHFAVLTADSILVFRSMWDSQQAGTPLQCSLQHTLKLENQLKHARSIVLGRFCTEPQMCVAVLSTTVAKDGSKDTIHFFKTEEGSPFKIAKAVEAELNSRFYGPRVHENQVILQDQDGGLHRVTETNGFEVLDECFPEFCATFEILTSTNCLIPVGLTLSNKLFVGYRLLVNNCSSFTLDGTFLVFTTLDHHIKFVAQWALQNGKFDSEADVAPVRVAQNNFPSDDVLARRVERGSTIVTVVPTNMALILQMPRGNLETISPRPLVLQTVRSSLDQLQYKQALLACRKHRIDLNIIHDHDPTTFMNNVDKFVDQVANAEHFNLFLAALKPIDVTTDMYKSAMLKDSSKTVVFDLTSKVRRICDAVRQEVERKDTLAYFNTILTSHVANQPPDYENALRQLSQFRQQYPDRVEAAVKYIMFLGAAVDLYNVSLGIYDLSLAVLIAQQSQMDPKEYLPFLQSLKALPPPRQKFKIDDYLRRYDEATSHLIESDESFDNILAYVKRHHLYNAAIAAYQGHDENRKHVRKAYGEYLVENDRYMEAGLVFELAEEPRRAAAAYTEAEAWQEAMSTLKAASPSTDELKALAIDLIDRLTDSGRHQEASRIYIDYLGDHQSGITSLCQANAYSEAIRWVSLAGKHDLINSAIKPSCEEYNDHLMEDISNMHEQVAKQRDRLRELLEIRQRTPDVFSVTQDDDGALDGVDAMTEATSALRTDYTRYTAGATSQSALSSRLSSKSSRSRSKKEARKQATGKKGTVYEEDYLLRQISQTCTTKITDVQNQVGTLLPTLYRLDLLKPAALLQTSLSKLVLLLYETIEEVWTSREVAFRQWHLKASNDPDSAEYNARAKGRGPWSVTIPKPEVEHLVTNKQTWKLDLCTLKP